MISRQEVDDFKAYEELYGDMYHLLLNKLDEGTRIKFVSDSNYPAFATLLGNPVFFDFDKKFRMAIDYTIIYPKIYVKKSIPVKKDLLPLNRSYLN